MLSVVEALKPSISVELSGRAGDDGLAVLELLESLVCTTAADSDGFTVVEELKLSEPGEFCNGMLLAPEVIMSVDSAVEV